MTVHYDPRRPENIDNPFPLFRRLQDEDPVHRSEVFGAWILTRYADVKAALSHGELSSNTLNSLFGRMPSAKREGLEELLRALRLWALFNDAPQHTRLRGLINKAFTPRAISALRPTMQAIVDGLLERMESSAAQAAPIDLIRDFAAPLPVQVILRMLGAPLESMNSAKLWSDEIALAVSGALNTPNKYERAQAAYRQLNALFQKIIAERRTRVADDILGGLLSAQEQNDALSPDEVLASCVMLLFAGHETTVHLIGNGMRALLMHPEAVGLLRARPELIESAVEEMLRYDGPAAAMVREARTDIEWQGKKIAAGERVLLQINAANRDPRVFAAPETLDIRRTPNAHLGFGFAGHYCIGAALARAEAQIAIASLLRRFTAIELAPVPPSWIQLSGIRGLNSLPIRVAA